MTTVRTPRPATTHRVQWWWLAFLGFVAFQPIFDPSTTTSDWVLAGAIVVVYVPLYLLGSGRPGSTRRWVVIASLALGLATTPLNSGASALFIYAGAFAGTFDPPAVARRWLAASFGLLAIAALLSPVPFPYNALSFGIPLVMVWFVGLSTMAEAERERESTRLWIDNARIGHVARMAERERIARDLHDLLGHSLTAVVVRAQVVQRLAATDPQRVRSEAADIETAAREALSAVRATVSGYRVVSLVDELAAARSALEAAGIDLDAGPMELDVAPEVESALAMALREGVTNVVRHAGARTCRVSVVRDDRELRLQIADDGTGAGEPEGSGLRGMRERIAALGGRVERTTDGGTRLTIAVPQEVAG